MAVQIAVSSCIEMRTNPGYYLRSDAAKAWDRAVAAFGKRVLITGAWRSYETQLRIFTERYDRGNFAGRKVNGVQYTTDVRWWPAKGSYYTRKQGFAAAAVPGTSNHGGGVAVDVKTSRQAGDPGYDVAVIFGSWTDTDRTRFLRVAAEHGWDDDEGRQVSELWHLTYYADRDQHRGEPVPTLPEKETFLMALSDDKQEKLAENAAQARLFSEQNRDKLERIEKDNERRHNASYLRERATLAEVTALSAGMKALAEAHDIDGDDLVRAVTSAAAAALKDLTITLSTEETP